MGCIEVKIAADTGVVFVSDHKNGKNYTKITPAPHKNR